MRELSVTPLRPTAMRRALLILPVLLLSLAGCGSAGDANGAPGSSTSTGSSPSAAQKVGSCKPSDPAVAKAPRVGSADLDGDGTAEAVHVTPAGGDCGGRLFARLGDGYVSTPLGDGDLGPTAKISAIKVAGHTGEVVVARQTHPRGGFQVRLYGVADGRLGEILSRGNAVVPFVATDTSPVPPLTVDCTDRGLQVTRAVAHEPAGVAFAWDLEQTSYTLEGNTASATGTTEVKDNVLPGQLKQDYPALAADQMFGACR